MAVALASRVHFEYSEDEISRFNAFKTEMMGYIQSSQVLNVSEVALLVESNRNLKYSHYEEFEWILDQSLEFQKFPIASILFKEGVRITRNLSEVILQVIVVGDVSFLESILKRNGRDLEYEMLIISAWDSGSIEIFNVLWFYGKDQLKYALMCELAKKALEEGKNEILVNMIESCPPALRNIILRSLLKISIEPERFFIIRMCVENDVAFIGLEVDKRKKILEMAAEIGCFVTTKAILKSSMVVESVLRDINKDYSPMNVSKKRGFSEISNYYADLELMK